MAISNKLPALLIAAGVILLLAIAGFLAVNRSHREKPGEVKSAAAAVPPTAIANSAAPADRMWGVMAGLADLDQHGPDRRPDKTLAEYVRDWGADPEKLESKIEAQVALVPYEGALVEPLQALENGSANSLDRARLLGALLTAAGIQNRIVSAPQDGKSSTATYASSLRAALPVVKPEILAAVKKEITDVSPGIFSKLTSGTTLASAVAGAKAEQRLYWVQYQRSGQWADLIPGEMKIGATQRAAAQVLSDAAAGKLAWQVKVTVTNFWTGDPAGKGKEILSYSGRASDLNAVAVTFLNRPDGSLSKFVPTILIGDNKIEGPGFEAKNGTKELRTQTLKISVIGPSETRNFVRTLVSEGGAASDAERGLEIATSARITVITGLVSDALFERDIEGNLAQSAKILFHTPDAQQTPAPDNSTSIPAIAVLDASDRYAGQLGEASKQVLAFQARPAVAIDRDFVQAAGGNLTRSHSFDLLDPGHALYGINISNEILMRAAVEQSAVDALLEDWMATGENVVTSRRAVKNLLTSGAQFSPEKPSSTLAADDFGKLHPVYRMGHAANNGTLAGWRLDPGPQIVPILADASGGTQSVSEQMARLKTLCTGLTWGAILVPAEIFPPTFMLGGIVNYDCQLAKAYLKSADVLNGLASQIGGEPAASGTTPDDVKKQIKEMTDGLINDIIKNSIGSAVKGLATHGITNVTSEKAESTIAKLVDAAGEYASSKLGGESDKEVLSKTDSAAIKDAVQSAEKLQAGGASPEQVEKSIQNHGH